MKLKVIGVPEHFNFPVIQTIAREENVELEFVPEGTGRMIQMIEDGQADLGIVLTEGAWKSMSDNPDLVCLGGFVSSSLRWGIHVAHHSPIRKPEELKGMRAAISRMNSGSHRMLSVFAHQMGWNPNSFKLEIVNTLEGAKSALPSGQADFFLWEKYTTQPVVDQQIFRRIGEVVSPWPCFVFLTHRKVLAAKEKIIKEWIKQVQSTSELMKGDGESPSEIAQHFGLNRELTRQWFEETEWFGPMNYPEIEHQLKQFGILDKDANVDNQLINWG